MQSGWLVLLPQLFLAAGGLLIFCAGAFLKKRPEGLLFKLALVAVLCALVAAAIPWPAGVFEGMADGGGYARFFSVLFSLITLLTLFISVHYARAKGFSGDEYYGVILFAAVGMMLVASAVHWLIFFLGLELLSISLYVLIASPKGEAYSNEAALKYFIMGSVASGFLTFGISMLYAVTGRMNIAESLGPAAAPGNHAGMVLGIALILVGVAFKVSLVPFHLWTPDVYQGAPAPVTAFLSTGSKAALFSAILRFAVDGVDGGAWTSLVPVLWGLAALTMVVGNVTALMQTRLKRLLAYSSVAQMGYLLMAVLAVKHNGAAAVMFYTAVYAFMDFGAFGTVALLSATRPDMDSLDEYRGLGYLHPWKAALLAVCLFSLAGMPPTAGFIGKFALFQATLQGGFVSLAVIGVIAAILSVYYYLKVIVILYMRGADQAIAVKDTGFYGMFTCAAVLVVVFVLGLFPSPLFFLITRVLSAFPI